MKLWWLVLMSTDPYKELQLMVTEHFFIRYSNSGPLGTP